MRRSITKAEPNVKPVSFRDILDGLSQTAAFSERVKGLNTSFTGFDPGRPSSAEMSVNVDSTGKTGTSFNDTIPNVYYAACKALSPYAATSKFNTSGSISSGEYWWDGHYETGHYNHIMLPNTWSCDDAANDWVNDAGASAVSSHHAGGVNLGFADGSVKFIKDSVATTTWWCSGPAPAVRYSAPTAIDAARPDGSTERRGPPRSRGGPRHFLADVPPRVGRARSLRGVSRREDDVVGHAAGRHVDRLVGVAQPRVHGDLGPGDPHPILADQRGDLVGAVGLDRAGARVGVLPRVIGGVERDRPRAHGLSLDLDRSGHLGLGGR